MKIAAIPRDEKIKINAEITFLSGVINVCMRRGGLMSVSSFIDFKMEGAAEYMSPLSVLHRLLKSGWTTEDHGGVSYLPLGDTGQYGWRHDALDISDIDELFAEKYVRNETIGISLTMQPENIGGLIVFFGENVVTFDISINRRRLISSDFTDFSWYIDRVAPPLNVSGSVRLASVVATEVRS